MVIFLNGKWFNFFFFMIMILNVSKNNNGLKTSVVDSLIILFLNLDKISFVGKYLTLSNSNIA